MTEFRTSEVTANPLDPLKDGPVSGKELFTQFSQVAHGFPHDAVVLAAVNMLINTIRQANPTRSGAEAAVDQLMVRIKSVLLDEHYTLNGARKAVFPFNQTIEVPLIRFKRN